MRCRGYVVQSGFKYGCDFILYKQMKRKHEHGEALVLIHNNSSIEVLSSVIASFVRLASIVRKKAYLAFCIDSQVRIISL